MENNNIDLGKIQAMFNKFYNTILLIVIFAIVAVMLISVMNLLYLFISSTTEKYKLYVNDYKIPNYKTYPFKLLEYIQNDSSGEPALFFIQQSIVTILIQIMLVVLFFVMMNVILYLIISLTNRKSNQPEMNYSSNKEIIHKFVFCAISILVAFFIYKEFFAKMVYEPLQTLQRNIKDIDKKVDMLLIDSKSVLYAAFKSNNPDEVLKDYWNTATNNEIGGVGGGDVLKRKVVTTLNIIQHLKNSNPDYTKDKEDYLDYLSNPTESKFSFVGFSNNMYPFIQKIDTANVERLFGEKNLSSLNESVRKDIEEIQKDIIRLRNDLLGPIQYIQYSLLNALTMSGVVVSGMYATGIVKMEHLASLTAIFSKKMM